MVDTFVLTRSIGFLLAMICTVFSFLLLKNIHHHPMAAASRIFLTGRKAFIGFGLGGLSYATLSFTGVFLKLPALKHFAFVSLMSCFAFSLVYLYHITRLE
jgi:hypothetical protein